ncbi:hypothetical protein HGRIS_004467 [Hohenbuehelia grisea]|uniref:MYND-type domain-containing protein n=1 Tax=Hohenbuehelia grisea TaxID=104357 RepID=A0ABR3JCS7_9AGAR
MSSNTPDAPSAPLDSTETEPTIYLQEILPDTTLWLNQRLDGAGVYEIERRLKLNSCITFERDQKQIQHCLIASQGNEYVAALAADIAANELAVIVYRTATDSMQQVWTSRLTLHPSGNPSTWGMHRENMTLHGYISADGERMLVEYNLDYGDPTFHTTVDRGMVWTQLRLKNIHYDSHGVVSADDEHILFLRRGNGARSSTQGEIVEAYSTRTWRPIKKWTFSFASGQVTRNISLLPHYMVDRPIYCVATAISGAPAEHSISLVSSTTGQHFFTHIDQSRAAEGVWISPDSRHMVYLPEDDGVAHYWDLTKPTLKPLLIVELPEVEKAARYIHRIHGKDTLVRHAINKQTRYCRFSPSGSVVSIAVANDSSVVINTFLTHNFQLVYQRILNYGLWPGWVVLQLRMSEQRGVSLVGATPHKGDEAGIYGLICSFAEVPGAYAEILKVESHFDSAPSNIREITSLARPSEGVLHGWRVTDVGMSRQSGWATPMTDLELQYQQKLFDIAFRGDSRSPRQAIAQNILHLLTISYPWDANAKALVFAVRMKYQYIIVAIGITPQKALEPFTVRVLYVSDNLYSMDPEQVEVFRREDQYLLRVSRSSDGSYSGIQLPTIRVTVVGHHFLAADATYDLFIVKESTSTTLPSGAMVSPNLSLAFTSNFAAYYPPGYLRCGGPLDYGYRIHSSYTMAKLLMWLSFTHRSRRNEPFFGGGELMDNLGETFDMVFEDRVYDSSQPLFASGLAAVADLDHFSSNTQLIDEFFRKFHRSDKLVLQNSQAISASFGALCRSRPLGLLSFMRHIALFKFHIADTGAVEVSDGAHEAKRRSNVFGPSNKYLHLLWEVGILLKYIILGVVFRIFGSSRTKTRPSANSASVTIPLDGFCTFSMGIRKPTGGRSSYEKEHSGIFYDLAAAAYYRGLPKDQVPSSVGYRLGSIEIDTGKSASPFTSFIEEMFLLEDRELQIQMLKVVWIERLIMSKATSFAGRVYLTRIAAPLVLNVAIHLAIGILTTRSSPAVIPARALGGVQAAINAYLLLQKARQARGTRLFFVSIYNYFDVAVIALSFTMAGFVLAARQPPKEFIAYSTPVLWIDLILAARVYEPAGTLMILLTEMTRGVMGFLGLLALFIMGFTFVPYFLLRNEGPDIATNPFRDYGRSLGEMITFMSNDFNSLDPWKADMVAIRILRAIFTVTVSILLLNCLIALLNLKVEAASQNSRNIWVRQMAKLIVEVECGLLADRERSNPYWFPRWFTYSLTEGEKREWESYVRAHPLGLGYDDNDDGGGRNTGSGSDNRSSTANAGNAQVGSRTSPTQQSARPASGQPVASSSQTTEAPKNTVSHASSLAQPHSTTSANAQLTPVSEGTHASRTADSKGNASSEVATDQASNPMLPSKTGLSSSVPNASPQACATDTHIQRSMTPPRSGASILTTPSSKGPAPLAHHSHDALESSIDKTSTDVSDSKEICHVCGLPAVKVCSGCKAIRYCTIEHQNNDWKRHKKDCRPPTQA